EKCWTFLQAFTNFPERNRSSRASLEPHSMGSEKRSTFRGTKSSAKRQSASLSFPGIATLVSNRQNGFIQRSGQVVFASSTQVLLRFGMCPSTHRADTLSRRYTYSHQFKRP